MKYFVWVLVFFVCGAVPSYSQVGKQLVRNVVKGAEASAAKGGKTAARAVSRQAVEEARHATRLLERKLLSQAFESRHRQVERTIRQSIFQVIMPLDGSTRSSGFVFERDGEIWGVVPYHISGRVGNRIKMRFYREDGRPVYYFGYVESSGSYGFNGLDAALISLPQEVREHVKPLVISQEGPQKNTFVDSFGFPDPDFWPKDYSKNPNRRILDLGEYKIITTLPEEGRGPGACGGPLLNAKGEVVGIHSGSYKGKLGFAVNARAAIDDLFTAMENGGKLLKPLMFNGVKIGDINISENIGLVEVRRDGPLVFSRDFKHYPGSFNHAQLEKVIPAQKGDKVFIFIQQGVQEVRMEVYTVR